MIVLPLRPDPDRPSRRAGLPVLLAALAVPAAAALAGCGPAGGPSTGVDGVTPRSVAPEDFPDPATAPPAPGGLFDCDPHGFGPLSGCAHGTVTPNADNAVATVPGGDPVYVVTAKFHRAGEYPGWCVESRVPLDVQARFSRDCVPDQGRTAADQDWLDHQVVGRAVWDGAR